MIEYVFAGMIGGLVLLGTLYLISAIQDYLYSRNRKIRDELKEEIRRQLQDSTMRV